MSNRISFIELEVKKCQLVYGSSPCTASVGVTGTQKCFNSRATCQDLPNINEANETVRLAKPSSIKPNDINSPAYIENIESIQYTPPALDLGRSIGVRASLSVSFKDHRSPDSDASGDPYLSDRAYDPYTLGTYFGKLKARHPFLRGQSIFWVQGRSDQSLADMERRHLVVESTSGPNSSGTYNIVAKDILKLTQGDRSLAPKSSNGYLTAPVSAAQGVPFNIVLSPAGIGNVDYPTSGKLNIGGKEIVTFTNRINDQITISARAQNNTVAVAHDTEDRAQLCLEYTADTAAYILRDLLVSYAGIDTNYISVSDWAEENTSWLNRSYSAVIAEPTAVNTLVNEMLEQTGSSMWWDNLASRIRWSVLKNQPGTAFEFNESNYLQGSFNIADQFDKRVSRVIVNYGQINPLLNLNDQRNYSSSLMNIDLNSEAFFNGVPAYREIFSRWVLGDLRDTASTMAELITQRYAMPPRKIGFRILRDSLDIVPELAEPYGFKNLYIQDENGNQKLMPIQVTSVNPSDSSITVNAEEVTFSQIIARSANTVTLNPGPTFTSYNIYERAILELGAPPTSATVVNVFVNENITIGSTGTGSPAMTTGSGWPAGAVINLYIRPGARILGAGGNGGNGGSAKSELTVNPSNTVAGYDGNTYVVKATVTNGPTLGQPGGIALQALHNINVYNDGIIGGGGGGGGGGGAAAAAMWLKPFYFGTGQCLASIGGSGGSGGAGSPAGSGGAAGTQINTAIRNSTTGEIIGSGFPPKTEWTDPSLYKGPITLPFGGLAGGSENGGAVQVVPFQDSIKFFNQAEYFGSFVKSETNSVRGKGGNLGSIGVRGSDGFADWNITNIPTSSYGGDKQDENGVNGGDSGLAVQKNGNTVNFLITGDIRGGISV